MSDKEQPTTGIIGDLVGPPRGRWGQRIATATATVTAGKAIWQAYNNRQHQYDFTVAVNDNDELYGPVQQWVLDRMPPDQQRALVAHTRRAHRGPEMGGTEPSGPLRLFYDGSRMQTVVIDGHPVQVAIERESNSGADGEGGFKWRPDRVLFYAKTVAARDAVVAFLAVLADELAKAQTDPRLFTATRWGDWSSNRSIMPRPLSSVVLRAGLMEDLVADLEAFYSHEADYVRLGIPWHRGYLFHGPPGTGKTSAAKALAGHLGLDMYYVPLADLKTDTDLDRLVGNVSAKAVLLLEDIDVLTASHDRDADNEGLTLTGLLNALDGVVTPHGLVTIMTTNRLDVLDDALTRRGRADRVDYIGPLDVDQFLRLVKAMTGLQPVFELDEGAYAPIEVTAADVGEVVKQHLDNPREALGPLRELVPRLQLFWADD